MVLTFERAKSPHKPLNFFPSLLIYDYIICYDGSQKSDIL